MQTAGDSNRIVLVFLKYPRPGQVKTRLAREIGNEAAAVLYRSWLEQVFKQLQPVREMCRVIGYYDGAMMEEFAPWGDLVDEWWPQPVGDLAIRLEGGFARAFEEEGANSCLAVGTDCLELNASDLTTAWQNLLTADAVFGPTLDGGYYLVGTRRHLPNFFQEIRFSTAETLSDQLRQCRQHQWTTCLLETRRDIDTLEDWIAHQEAGR